jgi:hypothetical protein
MCPVESQKVPSQVQQSPVAFHPVSRPCGSALMPALNASRALRSAGIQAAVGCNSAAARRLSATRIMLPDMTDRCGAHACRNVCGKSEEKMYVTHTFHVPCLWLYIHGNQHPCTVALAK